MQLLENFEKYGNIHELWEKKFNFSGKIQTLEISSTTRVLEIWESGNGKDSKNETEIAFDGKKLFFEPCSPVYNQYYQQQDLSLLVFFVVFLYFSFISLNCSLFSSSYFLLILLPLCSVNFDFTKGTREYAFDTT